MKEKIIFTLLALALCLTLASCEHELATQKASLTVKLENEVSKTIMPKQNLLQITRYSIEGSGPGDTGFSPVYGENAEVSVSELAPGSWTITARAYNAEGMELAQGTASCTLERGENNVTVVLDTIPGTGTAQIAFTWDETISSSSTIKIITTFESDAGVKITNQKVANTSEKKTTITQSLTAGSYVVSVQVSDSSGSIALGAAEALRIVDKTQSIGVIPLVSSGSGVKVEIENQVATPMQVYIDYTPKVPVVGQTVTLKVNLNEMPSYATSSDLKYQWYKDGVLMKVGSATYSITAEKGIHRYDAIVTNTRKGSTSSATVTLNL